MAHASEEKQSLLGPIPTPRRELLRVLGIGFGLAAVVGGAVGQGIMRTPGIVAGAVPDATMILLLWAVGGLLAMLDAFAVAELGASIPHAGGPYVFAGRAFGPFAGTMLGWTDWINGTIGAGFMAVVFAEYMHRLGIADALPIGPIAVALIVGVWAVNWIGTRACGASQGIGTALKGLGLLALIALLFASSSEAPRTTSQLPPSLSLAALIIALRAVSNTYSGWHTGLYFCEEMKRPERNIVRATFGGLALITGLYLLANAAMLHVLTPEQMASSKLPAADAAAVAYGEGSALLITGVAIVSVVAISNLYLMFLTRIAFSMARDRILPSVFARVSSNGTPTSALLLTAATAAAFAATGVYERLIAIAAPTTIVLYAAMDLSAIRMRLREPSLPRPYRMPWFPLPAVLGLAMNVVLLCMVFYEDPWNSTLGVGLVVLIGLAYKLPSISRPEPESVDP